jgi:hypothetical protein
MTSAKPSERRFTKVDTWEYESRPFFLREDDICYYHGEYTPRAKWSHSATNNLISNFKKEMDRKDKPEWRFKEGAIREAGALFDKLSKEWLRTATLVPMPPSKARTDPDYDDRLLRMLKIIEQRSGMKLDIRELLYQTRSTRASSRASSQGEARLSLEELKEVYRIDENLVEPWPTTVGVFDDLISAGRHFRVAKDLLQGRFPEVDVIGFFLARTIEPNEGSG